MAKITEIAPDLFRITTFVEPFNIQFSQFLMRDDQPLLFHTGPRALFPEVKAACFFTRLFQAVNPNVARCEEPAALERIVARQMGDIDVA